VKLVARSDDGGGLLVQQGHDLVHQGQLLLLPLGLGQRRQGDFAELVQVAGQALGGGGWIEGLKVVQRGQMSGEHLVKRLSELVVVEAYDKSLIWHGAKWAAGCWTSRCEDRNEDNARM
jgi:hypothetical protein